MEENMTKVLLALFVLWSALLVGMHTRAVEVKTDPSRDVFVENSSTNFVLIASSPQTSGKNRLGFELSAPSPGDYTIVCFIDGKVWKSTKFNSPGTFELSVRGMPPGSYRITLQLINAQGQIGSSTQIIQIK